jgi:hypothetical protein
MKHENNDDPDVTNIDDLYDDDSLSPMQKALQCRTECRNLDEGYRTKQITLLGNMARVADAFERDPKAWKAFINDPFWEGVRRKDRPKKKREKKSHATYVIKFVMDALHGAKAKQAWKYARVLNYIAQKVPAGKAAEEITRLGGIEEVYKLATREDPIRPAKEVDPLADIFGPNAKDNRASKVKEDRAVMLYEDEEDASLPIFTWGENALKKARELALDDVIWLKCKRVKHKGGDDRYCLRVINAEVD